MKTFRAQLGTSRRRVGEVEVSRENDAGLTTAWGATGGGKGAYRLALK